MAALSLAYLSKNLSKKPVKKWILVGLQGFLTLSCLGFLMALPMAPAQAAQSAQSAQSSSPTHADKPAKKKQSARSKKAAAAAAQGSTANRPAKASFLPSSQEPVSVRNARLKRECKGRVNAGACAGFTY